MHFQNSSLIKKICEVKNLLEVKNLCKSFKDLKAVDDVSFKVNDGEIVGLLGENGAGKTTTLRLIATMLKPTLGTAIVNNKDIVKNPEEARIEIGILFGGETGLYDRLTGRENIVYFGELNGMSKQEANKRVDLLSKEFEMEEYIDKRCGKFSKGMKQKISIARSLVHSPKLMLLDEPTSGLDVSATNIVQDFIHKCKNEGKAIIFSSHLMSEVEKLCDRVVIIHRGKLIEDLSLNDLRKKYNESSLEDIFINLIRG